VATADGGTTPKDHDGWMWDLTVPGNNDHDFYVIAGTSGILAHNETCTSLPGDPKESQWKYRSEQRRTLRRISLPVRLAYLEMSWLR
jgi:hypothetical protein